MTGAGTGNKLTKVEKWSSGRPQKCEHPGGLCALTLLLWHCGRFGFERLPLGEDPPLQLDNSSRSASCFDGVQNQDEAGIDCGGGCGACASEPAATCFDGVQNQDEAGIDCGGAACPACVPTRCNQVVADSVADFSSVQGGRGWYYGYYAEPLFSSADFVPLSIYEYVAVLNEDIWRYGDQAWTHIGARVMHPNGRFTTGGKLAIDQFAVRRWVSNTTETLFIQGTIQTTSASANGVLGRILVGDSEVWRQFIGPGATSASPFQTLASVRVGDPINFLLEPFESNDSSDATDFIVQICR